MARLNLWLLGTPEVHHHGQPVTFPTRKVLALLAYLATESRPHSREKLAVLFWPDSHQGAARGTLRSTLARLREALGGGTEASHIVVERELIRLERDSDIESDLHALVAAHDVARTLAMLPGGETRRVALAQVQQAVGLWRGEFLEGFSLRDAPEFDEWAGLQRDAWRRRMGTILNRLSGAQADEGLLAGSLDTVDRWMALDPLDEEAHRRLIKLHLGAGHRTAALRAYQACRALLKEKLGTDPGPETEVLAHLIRAESASPNAASPESPAPPPLPSFLQAPLVGRLSELGKLIEVYHATRGGWPRLVVLQGEAGIGKTRLASEFLGWAAAQGADVLQGRAFEAGGRLPYQPLVDALRPRLDRENAPEDVLSDVWLAELSRLLPELRERYPDLAVPAGDEAAARTRLFEAVARLGQGLAERAPLVLFIDDVQWADAASLDVLRYVGRRWAESETPVLLLLALRSEELAITPALDDWLAALSRDLATTDLTLGRLSAEESAELLRGLGVEAEAVSPPMSDGAADTSFTRWLFTETRGQPLFIVETLRALVERGAVVPRLHADGRWSMDITADLVEKTAPGGVLARGVQEVIHFRLARLTSTSQVLLTAAGVLGEGFTFEQVFRVAGVGEDDALQALDELLRAQLLREIRDEGPRFAVSLYGFSHDKIRDVVYTKAGEARRQVFHRRALEVIEADGAAAAGLAHHAFAAGDWPAALRLSTDAGDEAMAVLAARDATRHYSRAIDLAEGLSERDLLTSLRARRGRAFASRALWAEAKQDFEAALAGLGEDQREQRAELLASLLEAYWWLLDVSAMRARAGETTRLAREVGRRDIEVAVLVWLANGDSAEGDLSAAQGGLEHAVAWARQEGIPPPSIALPLHSAILYWRGRFVDAETIGREAVRVAGEARDIPSTLYSLPHLGLALAGQGRYVEAQAVFEEARQLGREHGIGSFLARSVAMSGGWHLDVADYGGAESIAMEARELARGAGFAPTIVSAGIDLLLTFARRGEVARAEALLAEVSAAAAGTAGFHGWLWSLRLAEARAEIGLARGEWEEAIRGANEAIEQSRAKGRVKYQVLALLTRARALHGEGRAKKSIADLRRAVDLARSIGDAALFPRAAAALLAMDGEELLATEVRAAVGGIARALPNTEIRRSFEAAYPVPSP